MLQVCANAQERKCDVVQRQVQQTVSRQQCSKQDKENCRQVAYLSVNYFCLLFT